MNLRKLFTVVLGISLFMNCGRPQPTTSKDLETGNQNIVGHYQFFTTGDSLGCEIVKHEFDLDTSRTGGFFLYHVFCHPTNGDSTGISSSLKTFSMIGKWVYTSDSSLIRLVADNGKIIKLRIADKIITDFFDDNNKQLSSGGIFFYSSN